jgi:hypothetical protein
MRCAADWPVRSVFRTSSLPQGGPQVLGANLKCSESRLGRRTPQDSTWRWGRRRGCPNHARLCQANAEHCQQCTEFLLLRNHGLGPLTVAILPIPLARRAAATLCNRQRPFFVAGDRQGFLLWFGPSQNRTADGEPLEPPSRVWLYVFHVGQRGAFPITRRTSAARMRCVNRY